MQLAAHLARHATEVTVNVKNSNSNPVMIAPIMLVATNSIAKSITEVRIVPRIPVKRADKTRHTQFRVPKLRIRAVVAGVNAR